MKVVELEDFTPLLEPEKEKEKRREKGESLTVEEVESVYRKKILELQRRHSLELEEVKKTAYEEGFKSGYEKARREVVVEYEKKLEEMEARYREELNSLKLNLDAFQKELERKKKEVLKKIESLFISYIIEILEFLYISPDNSSFVAEKVREILKEFLEEELIEIEVGKNLASFLEAESVKVSNSLGDNDFKISFKDFSIESRLKEKLALLREEIEREIKKSS
jgi:flagellar biosynthesis/type III secretory pathway protein FliH